MKKSVLNLILTFLSTIMLTVLFAVSTSAEVSGDFEYIIKSDGTVEICAYRGTASDLAIPNAIDGYIVTSIGELAFYGCADLESISIPEGVQNIGVWAFSGCSALVDIAIPESLETIDNYAFYDCESLTIVTIPSGVRHIGYRAFNWCTKLQSIALFKGSYADGYFNTDSLFADKIIYLNSEYTVTYNANGGVNAPEPQTKVHNISLALSDIVPFREGYMFEGWSSIPNGVVEYSASENYDENKSITLYAVWEKIPPDYSGSCGENVTWELYKSTGEFKLIGTGEMTNYPLQEAVPWEQYKKYIKSVIIESGVTNITDTAFDSCYYLSKVAIPNSVSRIGIGAFAYCYSITNISLPDGVERIGGGAFEGCYFLESITIPDTVTRMDDLVFRDCSSLSEFVMPNSVKSLGHGIFSGCSGMKKVTLSDNLTDMRSIFGGCSSLVSITIPENIKRLDKNEFINCKSLEAVNIFGDVDYIDADAFFGCDLSKLVIYTFEGSAAEAFAKENGIMYKALNGDQRSDDDRSGGCIGLFLGALLGTGSYFG